nr:unnamed protein product [Callosobruchus analis]
MGKHVSKRKLLDRLEKLERLLRQRPEDRSAASPHHSGRPGQRSCSRSPPSNRRRPRRRASSGSSTDASYSSGSRSGRRQGFRSRSPHGQRNQRSRSRRPDSDGVTVPQPCVYRSPSGSDSRGGTPPRVTHSGVDRSLNAPAHAQLADQRPSDLARADEIDDRGTRIETGHSPTLNLETDIQLPEATLEILGDDPGKKLKENSSLHSAINSRWTHYLTNGIPKDDLSSILTKYDTPTNCPALIPPALNAEVVGALSAAHAKRDSCYTDYQKEVARGLSALGHGISTILGKQDKPTTSQSNQTSVLSSLVDTGKILTNLFFNISNTRRSLILPLLDKSVRDIVSTSKPQKYLFGEDLGEKIKLAKSIEKIGKDIRPMSQITKIMPRKKEGGQHSAANSPQPLNSRRPARQRSYPGGRVVIRQALLNKGTPEQAVDTTLQAISPGTMKQYGTTYRLWWHYCSEKNIEPFNASAGEVICFLQDLLDKRAYKYGTFNSHRSALALITPGDLGQNNVLKRFLKGVSRLHPATPRYNVTWDPSNVLKYLKDLDTKDSLKRLSEKLATLLALITGGRLQTLALIRISNIVRDNTGLQVSITDLTKTSLVSKAQPYIRIPFYHDDPNLCVATLTNTYISATKNIRGEEDYLFITFSKPHKQAKGQTIARWIKTTLQAAGVDTYLFKPQSTRHASTSAAFRRGIPLQTIFKTAGWTDSSSTFGKFLQPTDSGRELLCEYYP